MQSSLITPRRIATALFAGIIFYGLYLSSLRNFLMFHTLAELFSILIAIGAWVIAWNARHYLDNKAILFLGIAYLFVGIIDLGHTLAYQGMNIFIGYDANLPTQLWLAARFLQAGSLLVMPLIPQDKFNHRRVFLIYALVTAFLFASIFYLDLFPTAYVAGVGLTTTKVISEYLIAFTMLAALVLLLSKGDLFSPRVMFFISASIALTILSELAFTRYADVTDTFNVFGHLLKISAFYLVYKAVIETGLTRPIELLFRKLQMSKDELEKERNFISAVLNTTNAFVVVTNIEGQIVRLNHACEQLTGKPSKEMERLCIWETGLVSGDPDQMKTMITQQLVEGLPLNHETRLITKDHEEHDIAWTSTPFTDQDSAADYIIWAGIDITERKQVEEELRFLSTHDVLTGLYNRSHFEAEMVRLAQTDRFPASIVVVDVDRLKEVNDTYGHAAGDKLIQRTAGILKSAFRSGDIIARTGGDEFAILLPDADESIAEQARKRVKAIQRAHNRKHPDFPISLSSGAATAIAGYMLMETLKMADKVMYREKFTRHKQDVEI